jgi:hypothetical protein
MPKSPFTGEKPWILLTERSPHGPRPITLMADGERIDNNLPYYVRSKANRARRAATVKLCDVFGTHLVCSRKACRRAGACSDSDLTKLPACYHRHREALRHLLLLAAEDRGLDGPDAPNTGGAVEESEAPQPFTGVPLLKRLLDAGAPREVLERPTGSTRRTGAAAASPPRSPTWRWCGTGAWRARRRRPASRLRRRPRAWRASKRACASCGAGRARERRPGAATARRAPRRAT